MYCAEDGANDARCVKREGQRCWNDYYKDQLRDDVARELVQRELLDEARAKEVADIVHDKTRVHDLIEFSRAVHAEMAAILAVARKGASGVEGATLYTTTFPCHSCARHIVAAGITRVVYVEPYERSLAVQLHDDAITLDPDTPEAMPGQASPHRKVRFVHFEGVAPRRYAQMFLPAGERKKSGVAVMHPLAVSRKALPEYLDPYQDFEVKVVRHWKEIGADLAASATSGNTGNTGNTGLTAEKSGA